MSNQRDAWGDFVNRKALKAKGVNKYNARKTSIDGEVFDSAKEARRWQELRLLQAAGEIHLLKRQVPYTLFAMTPTNEGVEVGEYIADFVYQRDGQRVVEDCKSEATAKIAVYRLKRRIIAANYNIEIVEV